MPPEPKLIIMKQTIPRGETGRPFLKNTNLLQLGIGMLLLFKVFGYWYSNDHNGGIIGTAVTGIINKARVLLSMEQVESNPWGVFVYYMIISFFALLTIYRSGFPQNVGSDLSQTTFLTKMYRTNPAFATTMAFILKGLVYLFFLGFVYLLIDQLLSSYHPPHNTVLTLIWTVLLGSILIHTNFQKIPEIAFEPGDLDVTDQMGWIKLTTSQFAYIKSANSNLWRLAKAGHQVNVSFCMVKIFYYGQFTKPIHDVIVYKNVLGEMRYSFNINALPHHFSETLTDTQVKNLEILSKNGAMKSNILSAIDQKELSAFVEQKYNILRDFLVSNPYASYEECQEEYKSITQMISSYKIEQKMIDSIEEYFKSILTDAPMFEFTCTLTKDTAREYFEKEVFEKRKKEAEEIRKTEKKFDTTGRLVEIIEQNNLKNALIDRLRDTSLSIAQIRELSDLISELSSSSYSANGVQRAKKILGISSSANGLN